MRMIPEDAIERLLDGCRDISKECEMGVSGASSKAAQN